MISTEYNFTSMTRNLEADPCTESPNKRARLTSPTLSSSSWRTRGCSTSQSWWRGRGTRWTGSEGTGLGTACPATSDPGGTQSITGQTVSTEGRLLPRWPAWDVKEVGRGSGESSANSTETEGRILTRGPACNGRGEGRGSRASLAMSAMVGTASSTSNVSTVGSLQTSWPALETRGGGRESTPSLSTATTRWSQSQATQSAPSLSTGGRAQSSWPPMGCTGRGWGDAASSGMSTTRRSSSSTKVLNVSRKLLTPSSSQSSSPPLASSSWMGPLPSPDQKLKMKNIKKMTLSPITKTLNTIISEEDYNKLSGRILQSEVSQVSGRKKHHHHEDILSRRKKSSSSSLSALQARTASTVRLSMTSEASIPDDKCPGKAYLLERKQEVNLALGWTASSSSSSMAGSACSDTLLGRGKGVGSKELLPGGFDSNSMDRNFSFSYPTNFELPDCRAAILHFTNAKTTSPGDSTNQWERANCNTNLARMMQLVDTKTSVKMSPTSPTTDACIIQPSTAPDEVNLTTPTDLAKQKTVD